MTRSLALLALLLAAGSAAAQTVTPDERARMADNVRTLQSSLDAARDTLLALPSGADATELRVSERTLRERLRAAEADLRRADSILAAERQVPDAGPADRREAPTATPVRADPSASVAPAPAREDSVAASDGRRGPLSPFVLAMFTVLFALVLGLGWWVLNQRRRIVVPARAAYAAIPGTPFPGQTVSRAEFDRLRDQLQTLATEHRALNDWVRADYDRRQPAATPVPATPPVQMAAAPARPPADATAAAFADWCRQGTPMMSRVEFFAGVLGSAVPGASARAVYRDLNSQAEPVRFDDRGGASPAEFWLITAGNDTFLFPQPLNAGQFRDLTRVFEGSAAPKGLVHVTPARVRDEGGTFALTTPGRVA